MQELTQEERKFRVLAVVYSLAGGSTKVPVHIRDIESECKHVFSMTNEEFETYRAKSVSDAHVLDAEELEVPNEV